MKTILAVSVFASLSLPVMSVAASVYEMPAVLVTAERTEAEIRKEPQSAEIVTSEDIKRSGAYDMRSALSSVLNLSVERSRPAKNAGMGGHQVMLRGMNTNHTLVLVDGKRMADEDTSVTQNFYVLDRISVDRIDRVEIVRGASSALYGSDAMGGVINIITKKPEKREVTVSAAAGTNELKNSYRFDLGKEGRWSNAFDVSFIKIRPVSYQEDSKMFITFPGMPPSHGGAAVLTKGINTPDAGNRRLFHWTGLYDFENSVQGQLRFDAGYFNESVHSSYADADLRMRGMKVPVYRGRRENISRDGFDFSAEYTGRTGRNDYMVRAGMSRMKKDSYSYNGRHLQGLPLFLAGHLNRYFPKENSDNARYSTYFLEAKDTVKSERHTFTFGGDYRNIAYEGTRLADNAAGLSKKRESHSADHVAVYVSDLWQANDRLFITPSLRFEHHNRFGSSLSPRLGLTYEPDSRTRFKVNYGKGFKAPTISELYIKLHHFVNVYGNPDLEAEKSRSWDAGIEWERGRSFGRVTYFDNRVKNLIDAQPSGRNNDWFYQNISRGDIHGVETEWGYHVSDRLTFKVGHVYLDAKGAMTGKAEARLDNRARNTFSTCFLYDDHEKYGWSGSVKSYFLGDYQFDGKDYSYHTLDISARKKWGEKFSATLALYNIFGRKVDDLYLGGREWAIGAEMKF